MYMIDIFFVNTRIITPANKRIDWLQLRMFFLLKKLPMTLSLLCDRSAIYRYVTGLWLGGIHPDGQLHPKSYLLINSLAKREAILHFTSTVPTVVFVAAVTTLCKSSLIPEWCLFDAYSLLLER